MEAASRSAAAGLGDLIVDSARVKIFAESTTCGKLNRASASAAFPIAYSSRFLESPPHR